MNNPRHALLLRLLWRLPRAAKGLIYALSMLAVALLGAEPIRLHSDNPHYFLFRGRPAVLITSTEHYGAVLNPDFDFVHMRPNQQRLRPWVHSASESFYVLEQPGKIYAVYFRGGEQLRRTRFAMDLPRGRWRAEWVTPRDGSLNRSEPFTHLGGSLLTETPEFTEDIALRLRAMSN